MAQAIWLGPKVGGHLVLFLYSSHEPSEISQCLCYDDSTINIIVVIVVMVICTFIRHKDRQYKIETETDRIRTRLKSIPNHIKNKNLLKHATNMTKFTINRMVNHRQ